MKSDKIEGILNKILKSTYIMIVILLAIFIVSVMQLPKKEKVENTNKTETPTTESTSDYDIASFTTIDTKGAIEKFSGSGYKVIIFGSQYCGFCKEFVKVAKDAQTELGFTHYYVEVNNMSKGSTEYNTLMKKLDVKTTMKIDGKEETKTYGEFFLFTPITVIIKDDKMVDGIIGGTDYDEYIKLLNKNGIQ